MGSRKLASCTLQITRSTSVIFYFSELCGQEITAVGADDALFDDPISIRSSLSRGLDNRVRFCGALVKRKTVERLHRQESRLVRGFVVRSHKLLGMRMHLRRDGRQRHAGLRGHVEHLRIFEKVEWHHRANSVQSVRARRAGLGIVHQECERILPSFDHLHKLLWFSLQSVPLPVARRDRMWSCSPRMPQESCNLSGKLEKGQRSSYEASKKKKKKFESRTYDDDLIAMAHRTEYKQELRSEQRMNLLQKPHLLTIFVNDISLPCSRRCLHEQHAEDYFHGCRRSGRIRDRRGRANVLGVFFGEPFHHAFCGAQLPPRQVVESEYVLIEGARAVQNLYNRVGSGSGSAPESGAGSHPQQQQQQPPFTSQIEVHVGEAVLRPRSARFTRAYVFSSSPLRFVSCSYAFSFRVC